MSVKTDALEDAVAQVLQARTAIEASPGARQRAAADRAFARLLKLLAPRIRYFIARYRLTDMADDAHQVCAIALHRAVLSYDPAQAKFTTFINWQLRGELQGLRFRVRTDSRGAAKKVAAETVSFETLTARDGTPFEQMIRDEEAETRTESRASAHMAVRTADRLIDDWQARTRARAIDQAAKRCPGRRRIGDGGANLPKFTRCRPGTVHPDDIAVIEAKLARERMVVRDYLIGNAGEGHGAVLAKRSYEQDRPILRRALREISIAALPGRPAASRAAAYRH